MLTEDQQIIEQIQKANNILITFKKSCSGDALASALALFLFLKKLNKKATIASPNFCDNKKHNFSFLPNINAVQNNIDTVKKFIISLDTKQVSAQEISYQVHDKKLEFIIIPKEGKFKHENITSQSTGGNYDLIITVATPDLDSMENIYSQNTELFFNTPIINIDHHPDNEEFGQINKIKITAISTTEIIFKLIKDYNGDLIDSQIATCLLTGIISESKSFKIGSLTPNSLIIASQLINLGADREKIIQNLYQNKKINTLKLWGRVLARLNNDLDGKLIWSTLSKVDFEKTSSNEKHLDDVIEELIVNVPEAEVIVILSENGDSKAHASIYTIKNINAVSLLKEFNAQGNKNYSTISSNKQLADLEKEIISHIKNKLNKLPV